MHDVFCSSESIIVCILSSVVRNHSMFEFVKILLYRQTRLDGLESVSTAYNAAYSVIILECIDDTRITYRAIGACNLLPGSEVAFA